MRYTVHMRFLVIALLLTPAITHADSVQQIITNTLSFINNLLIPFILAIAFFIFVVNVVRFFIIGGATEDGQKNGKSLIIYSLLAFVVILSFWGIVNLLIEGFWGSSAEINPDCHFRISDYVANDTEDCATDPYGYGAN